MNRRVARGTAGAPPPGCTREAGARGAAGSRRRTAAPWAAALLLACTGCQATHRIAKKQATDRWNAVRAQVKARLAADQLAAGNVADAAGELADAYRLDPTIPELVPLQARVHLARGDANAAQRFLEAALKAGSASAEVYYLLGVTSQNRQRWETALDHFTRASRQNPQEVAYFVAVVQTLLQLGRTDAARDWLRAGQERFDWTGAYQAAWAEYHEQLGDWDAAATAWARVIGPDADADTRARLGMALYRAGRLDEALPVLTRLVEDDPSASSDCLRLALAECLVEDGQSDRAHEQVAAVLRLDERNVAAWRLLARILAVRQQFDRGLEAARRALTLDPDDEATLELAAGLAHRAGDGDLAAALARRLLERDPAGQNPVARLILSDARPTAHQPTPARQ